MRFSWETVITVVATNLVTLTIAFLTFNHENALDRAAAERSTVAVNVEARRATEAQALAASRAFRLEATRLVMAEKNCRSALARARFLRALFPELGSDFAEPVQVAVGRYRLDRKARMWIPLPDPTGCTQEEPMKATARSLGFAGPSFFDLWGKRTAASSGASG